MELSRRGFLTTSALVGAGAALGGTGLARGLMPSASAAVGLPDPSLSGIDHIVVVMMENRSFDHFLGWLPGADGKQAGLSFLDRYGHRRSTHHLSGYASCGYADPDHSWEGGRIELNGGRCDGWLRAGENDALAIGYYTQDDLSFLGSAAPAWTVCDRYFSAVMAETYPNRFYQHAAMTDRLHNTMDRATMPTVWDRLKAAGISGKYYFSDIPFTALWYEKHLDITVPFADFLLDAALGRLPAVSFVDPRFQDEASGTSGDDHPHADIRSGEAFLGRVYDAVTSSPNWERTLLVINYDEWGGFFDHVAPRRAPDVSARTALRGFRVPAVVVSPRARRGHVAHGTYDHTSVLRAIEWRWGLQPLTPRDAHARNIAEVLDFESAPDLSAPAISVPPFVPSAPCPVTDLTGALGSGEPWQALGVLYNTLTGGLPL